MKRELLVLPYAFKIYSLASSFSFRSMSLSWSNISLVFSWRRFSKALRLVEHVLVVQPALLHGRDVLRAELLVYGRSFTALAA